MSRVLLLVTAALAAAAPCGAQSLDCSSAAQLACDEPFDGTNIGAPANADSYSCTVWDMGGGEAVHVLTLEGPSYWYLDIDLDEASYGCDLRVFLLGSCDELDCIDAGTSGIATDPLPPGTYYIVVEGGWDYTHYDMCEYTLTVECTATEPPVEECCPVVTECVAFNFAENDGGYYRLDCGGATTWEWGQMPGPMTDCDGSDVTQVLATNLDGVYPPNSGEAAVIGPVPISADCSCLEVCHTYDIEEGFDGGSVKVSADAGRSWDLVYPARSYPTMTQQDCSCIPGEPAFGEHYSPTYRDCFDLSQYVGSEVLIGFFFGSDDLIERFGWIIFWAKVGTDATPVEPTSWGTIKAMYR